MLLSLNTLISSSSRLSPILSISSAAPIIPPLIQLKYLQSTTDLSLSYPESTPCSAFPQLRNLIPNISSPISTVLTPPPFFIRSLVSYLPNPQPPPSFHSKALTTSQQPPTNPTYPPKNPNPSPTPPPNFPPSIPPLLSF